MKTAISVQDNLFQRAEKFAKRKKMTRSKLYSEAIEEYLNRRESDDITSNLNEVYSQEASSVDPVLLNMALAALPEEEW